MIPDRALLKPWLGDPTAVNAKNQTVQQGLNKPRMLKQSEAKTDFGR